MNDKIREHIKRHKTAYAFNAGILVSTITLLIIKAYYDNIPTITNPPDEITVRPIFTKKGSGTKYRSLALVED